MSALRRLPKLGALCNVLAKNVSGRDLRDTKFRHQHLRLRPLANAGCTQKKNRPGQKMILCRGRSVSYGINGQR